MTAALMRMRPSGSGGSTYMHPGLTAEPLVAAVHDRGRLILQRQFVIMRVFGLVGGSDSSGGGLVPASPSGPVQLCRWCGQLPGQAGEQAADLVAGQRDQLMSPGGGGGQAAARTDKKAWASRARMVHRCQEVQDRTWCSSRAASSLPPAKPSPAFHRDPAGPCTSRARDTGVRGVGAVERQLAVADPAAVSRFPGEEPA